MESGAKGCEVIVSGKLRAARAKAMKFKDGYMVSSGDSVRHYIDSAVRHVLLRQGVLGIKVRLRRDLMGWLHRDTVMQPWSCSQQQHGWQAGQASRSCCWCSLTGDQVLPRCPSMTPSQLLSRRRFQQQQGQHSASKLQDQFELGMKQWEHHKAAVAHRDGSSQFGGLGEV